MRKIGLLLLAALLSTVATAQRLDNEQAKLLNAMWAIQNLYVDSVNEGQMVENAINGVLEKLDPHSSYTNAKETKELEEPLQGEFSGIGIQFNMKKDTLYVIQTIAGGPSERVGLLPGDRIIDVNDSTIAGVKIKNSEIQKKLRGKKGTKVTVKVKRGDSPKLITFVITRDKIPLHSVEACYMLDDAKTGYIKISFFGQKTYEEMMEALGKLTKQGMRQVIIDLSDNGGGYLNAAIEMSNEFLDRDQMIVYTQGDKQPRSEAKANGWGRYKDLKMAIIVSQFSASAAEIFAGAMQDWDRAVVVGRRTFAKGLVQRPVRFNDNSMMRLTVARYYTPSGRCIQKPYTKGNKKSYDEDIINRSKDGEYYHLDSIQFNDSLRYATLKNKRVIYGGGGIMPDIFVPVDTSEYTIYYRDMLAKGIIYQHALDYVDKHRDKLKSRYATIPAFKKKFNLTEADMKEFVAAGEKEKVTYNAEQYKTSEQLFCDILKGLIARDLFSDPGAYSQMLTPRNKDLQEAIKVLADDARFASLLTYGNPEYEKIVEKRKAQADAQKLAASDKK